MNLDDMKSAWQDDTDDAPEVCLEQQRNLRQPVDIICKNMRKEVLKQLLCCIIILFFILFYITNTKFLLYAVVIFSSIILMLLYYTIRLKGVYSSLKKSQYTSYQSLLELNYSLKYFKDLYISSHLLLLPFSLCGFMLWFDYAQGSRPLTLDNVPTDIILIFIAVCIYIFFAIKLIFHVSYGRYIFSIAQLLKTIEQPYEDFDKSIIHASNGNYLYSKTEKFCIEKMGAFGEKVNYILWEIMIILTIIIIFRYLIH